MYQAPQLQRYGTLRELTLGGGSVPSDGFTPQDTDGCMPNPNPGPPAGLCFSS